MRVVHYVNQFFGGKGGEAFAAASLEERRGPVGPGRLLEQLLGGDAVIVSTLICGDNYAVEHQQELVELVLEKVRAAEANLFVAGPCFTAGRYGMAAGALCAAVQSELGMPAITGMHRENPGVDLYRERLYIVDSGENTTQMRHVLERMARLARKLLRAEVVGAPTAEGYHPRGLLRDELVEKPAAERLVDMLMAKVKGETFESEMKATSFAPVAKPQGLTDLSRAKLMLITDGGLVPKGNPDDIEGMAARRWGAYNVRGVDDLAGEDYEISHGGYDPRFVQEDPDRLVPLDVLREMEKEKVIGELHNEFLSTSGLSNPLSNTRRMGREMVEKVKQEGVDAVILTST